ncbi:YhcN/YlaJ family sporulation lipoprotein [Peribacillus castrilensis]|uniref:YhcN/YlaJ family sporulation lipoprotein n=2 Tax=Bacillaceae TaxID=186817 RepID=UPI0006602DF7|nr:MULTISPECIES: YhcN/YlaJ family sporulation lipoprotein [Bacillaceae]
MKDKINQFIIFLLLLTIIGLGSGCNRNPQSDEGHEDLNISQVHTSKSIDQSVANQAKKMVITEEDISDVKAVNTDKELLIAIKVENFDRFRLKKIEKSVKSDLEKDYPDHKILVSTDSKMYLELDQLEQKIQKDNTNRKEVEKDFNKIKSLMKEKT